MKTKEEIERAFTIVTASLAKDSPVGFHPLDLKIFEGYGTILGWVLENDGIGTLVNGNLEGVVRIMAESGLDLPDIERMSKEAIEAVKATQPYTH